MIISNSSFCPSNSPKPKASQFTTIRVQREKVDPPVSEAGTRDRLDLHSYDRKKNIQQIISC